MRFLCRVATIRFIRKSFPLVLWLILAGLTGLVVVNSLGYLTHPQRMFFLLEKAEAARHAFWRYALTLHVTGGMVCLISVLLQFSRGVLRRLPGLHRSLGRAYAASTLFVLCPSGLVLAFFAKGGWSGVLGFLVLDVLTFWTTWRGVRAILQRDLPRHTVWMIRSFAMTSSAITFRIWHYFLQMTSWDYDTVYLVALWLSIAGNALAAEFLIRRSLSNRKQTISYEISGHRSVLHHSRNPELHVH